MYSELLVSGSDTKSSELVQDGSAMVQDCPAFKRVRAEGCTSAWGVAIGSQISYFKTQKKFLSF